MNIKIPDKETSNLVRELEQSGWSARRTGGGHLELRYGPTGQKVIGSMSPSDHRAVPNLRARCERVEREARERGIVPQTRKISQGQRGTRKLPLLEHLLAHPGVKYTIVDLAREVFPEEYARERRLCLQRVSTAVSELARERPDLERVQRGTYVLRDRPVAPEPTPDPAPEPHVTPNVSVYEDVRELRGGRRLLVDENGDLWVATRLEVE